MKAFAREDYFLARLSVYAATESDSSGLSIMFGIFGCEARIKTLIVSGGVRTKAPGKEPQSAAKREFLEETGMTLQGVFIELG